MSRTLRYVLGAAIVLGAFFRLYNGDVKLYSPEEIATSLFAAGHTNGAITALLRNGDLHRVSEIRSLIEPGSDASAAATWHAIASEHPQHPPGYFELMIAPLRFAGDSIFLRRLPAMLFGILAMLAAGWFAWRLTHDETTGWCAAALVGASPFHVAYAQENREYSLFALLICASSALLIETLEDGRWWKFVLYGLAVAAGVWTFTVFAVVIAAHGIYLLLPWRGVAVPRRLAALAALVLGAATFLPWIALLAAHPNVASDDMAWEAAGLPALLYAGKWLFNAGSVFFDLDYLTLALVPVAVVTLAIAGWASYAFGKYLPKRAWALIALLAAISLAVTLVPDLARHEERALQSRYLTTLWLALEIATAAGLASLLRGTGRTRAVASAALGALLMAGFVSDAVAAQARTWWNTGSSRNRAIPAIVDRLEREKSPTVVYLDYPVEILMYVRGADDDVSFRMHAALDAAALGGDAHPFAVLSPSEAAQTPVLGRLQRIPLDLSFEMRADPAIMALRHRGDAARAAVKAVTVDLDPTLYGTQP